MAANPEFKRRAIDAMHLPENTVCADCLAKDPRWASSKLGVFICINCSGIHRSLGTHISFVRSVELDNWKENETIMMEKVGNARANAYWEKNLPKDYVRPNTEDRAGMEKFINFKYVLRKWADPATAAPNELVLDPSAKPFKRQEPARQEPPQRIQQNPPPQRIQPNQPPQRVQPQMRGQRRMIDVDPSLNAADAFVCMPFPEQTEEIPPPQPQPKSPSRQMKSEKIFQDMRNGLNRFVQKVKDAVERDDKKEDSKNAPGKEKEKKKFSDLFKHKDKNNEKPKPPPKEKQTTQKPKSKDAQQPPQKKPTNLFEMDGIDFVEDGTDTKQTQESSQLQKPAKIPVEGIDYVENSDNEENEELNSDDLDDGKEKKKDDFNPFAQPAHKDMPAADDPFANPTNVGTQLFGKPYKKQQTEDIDLFGSPVNKDPFGAPSQQNDLFGTPLNKPSTPFGTPANNNDLFGAPSNNNQQNDLFGAPSNKNQQNDLFGAPSNKNNQQNDLFGAPANNNQPNPFLAPSAPQKEPVSAPAKPTDSDLFGSPAKPSTDNLFGAPKPAEKPKQDDPFSLADTPSPNKKSEDIFDLLADVAPQKHDSIPDSILEPVSDPNVKARSIDQEFISHDDVFADINNQKEFDPFEASEPQKPEKVIRRASIDPFAIQAAEPPQKSDFTPIKKNDVFGMLGEPEQKKSDFTPIKSQTMTRDLKPSPANSSDLFAAAPPAMPKQEAPKSNTFDPFDSIVVKHPSQEAATLDPFAKKETDEFLTSDQIPALSSFDVPLSPTPQVSKTLDPFSKPAEKQKEDPMVMFANPPPSKSNFLDVEQIPKQNSLDPFTAPLQQNSAPSAPMPKATDPFSNPAQTVKPQQQKPQTPRQPQAPYQSAAVLFNDAAPKPQQAPHQSAAVLFSDVTPKSPPPQQLVPKPLDSTDDLFASSQPTKQQPMMPKPLDSTDELFSSSQPVQQQQMMTVELNSTNDIFASSQLVQQQQMKTIELNSTDDIFASSQPKQQQQMMPKPLDSNDDLFASPQPVQQPKPQLPQTSNIDPFSKPSPAPSQQKQSSVDQFANPVPQQPVAVQPRQRSIDGSAQPMNRDSLDPFSQPRNRDSLDPFAQPNIRHPIQPRRPIQPGQPQPQPAAQPVQRPPPQENTRDLFGPPPPKRIIRPGQPPQMAQQPPRQPPQIRRPIAPQQQQPQQQVKKPDEPRDPFAGLSGF